MVRAGRVASALRRFAALLAAVVLLAGCSARSAPQRDAGTLVALTRADGATLNPLFAQTVQDALIYVPLVFESLSYIGPDYLPHPLLATGWRHAPDGRHWTVDLRRGVRWSDGAPFTSADVVFTYGVLRDPKVAAISAGDMAYITSVTADGPYRVHFVLAYPSAVFTLTALGNEASQLPEHLLGKVPHDRLRFTNFGEHPIGTGPYTLERWQHDSEIVFARNPYAWRRPKIGRIDMRIIFNDQSELEALANGSADLIDDLGSTELTQLQRIAPQLKFLTFPSVYTNVMLPNLKRPGLNDIAVRQAIMYGYDRKGVVDGFGNGHGIVPDGLIPAGLAHWHDPDVQRYPYDPEKARALLDAAGWKPGPDGIRRKGSTRLSFELLLNQGSAVITDEMIAFVADMQAIGIDISLRQLDFSSIVAREFKENFDLIYEGFGGSVDPDLTTNLASDQAPPNGANTEQAHDPIADRDLKRGLTELDDAKRRAYYNDLQREIAKTLPILYETGRYAAMAYSPRLLLDPKVTLQTPLLYYNVQDWVLTP